MPVCQKEETSLRQGAGRKPARRRVVLVRPLRLPAGSGALLGCLLAGLSVLSVPAEAQTRQNVSTRSEGSGAFSPDVTRRATPAPAPVSLNAALAGSCVPARVRARLAVVGVSYWSLDRRVHWGYLIVDKSLVSEVSQIFADLTRARFPIAGITPLSALRWSDPVSMRANNTSAFNYRPVPGTTQMSQHAFGRAIDINPLWNPYQRRTGAEPFGARYQPQRVGTIVAGGVVVRAFQRRGWRWGGRWRRERDWQHFDKPAP